MELSPRYARFVSYIVDNLLIQLVALAGAAVGGLIATLVVQTRNFPPDTVASAVNAGRVMGGLFWGFAAWILNCVVLQGLTGASVGKQVFGLRVQGAMGETPSFGKMAGRAIAQAIMSTPYFVLSHLVIFFTKNKQGLHDLMCGTVVVRRPVAKVIPLLAPAAVSSADAERKAA
ncbi:MAG: RDD family protein [Bacteriovoracia bacterium]